MVILYHGLHRLSIDSDELTCGHELILKNHKLNGFTVHELPLRCMKVLRPQKAGNYNF